MKKSDLIMLIAYTIFKTVQHKSLNPYKVLDEYLKIKKELECT